GDWDFFIPTMHLLQSTDHCFGQGLSAFE
ncbi:hypothetical protein MJO28_000419, partial [Puccinia striiformis f. sp. tritici]